MKRTVRLTLIEDDEVHVEHPLSVEVPSFDKAVIKPVLDQLVKAFETQGVVKGAGL